MSDSISISIPHDDHSHAHGHAHSHGPPVSQSINQTNQSTNQTNSHGHSHAPAAVNGHGHSHGPTASPSNHGHSHSNQSINQSSHGHSHGHSHSHGSTPCSGEHESLINHPSIKLSAEPPLVRLTPSLFCSLFSASDTRPLAIYLTLKLSFCLLLFGCGLKLAMTTLISNSFHVLFDCAAMACSLYAVLVARQRTRASYGYGFARFEVVAAFTNAIFLYFVATFLLIELFHALTTGEGADGPSHGSEHQLVALGLIVDVIGIALFVRWSSLSKYVQTDSASPQTLITSVTTSSASAAHAVNMHSIWLFTVSDLLQHCLFLASNYLPSVLKATLSAAYTDRTLAISTAHVHALSFFITAIALFKFTSPLFRATGRVLLASTEPAARQSLERALREISFGDGVLEVRQAHFWSISPMPANATPSQSSVVGSVVIRCRADSDAQQVLSDVHNCLGKVCKELTVQIEKDRAPEWMTANIQ